MRYRRNMCDVYVSSFNYFVKLKHMSAFLKICLSTENLGRRYRAYSSVPLQNYTITHGIGGSAEFDFRRDEIVNGQCGLFNFAHTYLKTSRMCIIFFSKNIQTETTSRCIDYRQQSPWLADSVCQKISPHCFGARRSLSVHKSSQVVVLLGQMDQIHAFPSCMFKIHFNITLYCTHSHSFGFNPENAVHFSFPPCMLLSLPISFSPHLIARIIFHKECEL